MKCNKARKIRERKKRRTNLIASLTPSYRNQQRKASVRRFLEQIKSPAKTMGELFSLLEMKG